MADENIRHLSINQSMTKPLLILGCDRTLLTVSSLACLYVGFNLGLTRGKMSVFVLAIIAWFVIRFGLIRMGKADPYMWDVFTRSTVYVQSMFKAQLFIPAKSDLGIKTPVSIRKRWLK